jgi:hypothetical protein
MSERFSRDLLPLVKPIDFVIEDPDNAKLHPDESVDGIATSLETYGQYKPVVFWYREVLGGGKQAVVKMGNGTLRAAKKLGWKRLAVSEFEGSDREAKGAALVDNKLPELAPWNEDVLTRQVAELGLDAPAWNVTEIHWEAPTEPAASQAPPVATVIDVAAVPVGPTAPAAPLPVSTRVRPGDIWILTGKDDIENRLMCGDPKNGRVIKEVCGRSHPSLRRMVVPPDDLARWWLVPNGRTLSTDSFVWPGWNRLSQAFFAELVKTGWNAENVAHLTRFSLSEVGSWFSGEVLIPESAYDALRVAGTASGAFQHLYASLAEYHRVVGLGEKLDGEHIRSIVTRLLEPGEIFLDTAGGSGSFLGCMGSGRKFFMVLADPVECDTVLETVEGFTGRKAEKI